MDYFLVVPPCYYLTCILAAWKKCQKCRVQEEPRMPFLPTPLCSLVTQSRDPR